MFVHIIWPKWYGQWVQIMTLQKYMIGQNWYIKEQINKLLRQNAKFHLWHARCRILTLWDNRYILSICTVYSLHQGCIPVNPGSSRSNHLIQSDKLNYILHILWFRFQEAKIPWNTCSSPQNPSKALLKP